LSASIYPTATAELALWDGGSQDAKIGLKVKFMKQTDGLWHL
jgi:hypothetical protein